MFGHCVTILILIDGFLQSVIGYKQMNDKESHNPYFNRWFSAIKKWLLKQVVLNGHNPYFNRWFSAIDTLEDEITNGDEVTILILIDGFLQCRHLNYRYFNGNNVTILILIDGFLQYQSTSKLHGGGNCHNPYFNRWFSAIIVCMHYWKSCILSQSLF